MNSARLCIREMRRFERFHIGGSSEVYIIPRDTLFAADTSFLRSSESQEFDVVTLLSWVPEFLFSRRDARIKVTRYCRRLTSAFRPVADTLSQFLVFYATKKNLYSSDGTVSDVPLFCLNVSRRFFSIRDSREVSKVLWFFNLVRDFLLQLYFAL